MDLILRRRRSIHNDAGIDVDESETSLAGISTASAAVLAVALAGGIAMNAFDMRMLVQGLQTEGKVDIAASAQAKSPVRKRYDFDAMAARGRLLATLQAAEQTSFAWVDVTGEDILALVDEHGGVAVVERDESGVIDSITASYTTEYDSSEMQEVLESLHAAGGATPKKIVGDLAQAAISTANGLEQIISLAEWTISWKRKTVEATTTDDALYETSLGSSKSWTAKAKFMFVDGDPSQVDGVLIAIDTTSLDPITWTFFPTVEVARQAFQGLSIIDGIDLGSGSGKIVGLDVSLKGTGPLKRLQQIAPIATTTTVSGIQGQV